MTSISFDFANHEQASHYPRHGWAVNSDDRRIKLLWFPILNLLWNAGEIRSKLGAKKPLGRNHRHEHMILFETVRNLAIALRELHLQVRTIEANPLAHGDDVEISRLTLNAHEMTPLFVDLAYVYLRRVADRLVRAVRHVLFNNAEQAPVEFKKLKKDICNKALLNRWEPICDINILRNAITNQTSWFEKLRTEGNRPGIRDILEHHSVRLSVQTNQAGDNNPELAAYIISGNRFSSDLISTLREIVAGFCDICSEIQAIVDFGHEYVAADRLIIVGIDDDYTGFWPEI